jgi:hypothetical protein
MNDFCELENQLRKLRPVQPSSDLAARIERALAADEEQSISTAGVLPPKRRFQFNWLSLGLGFAAAAALVMFAFVRSQQPTTGKPALASTSTASTNAPNPSAQFVPAGLTQVVYHTRDEGLHFPTSSNQPMRRVRSQSRDTLQWRNPKTGATLRISYPSEQVSLIPVNGQ